MTISAPVNMRRLSAAGFNQLFEVGSSFKYYAIKNSPGFTWVNTRSEAWELGHGEPVVKISGCAGCVSISHLKEE